METAGYDSSRPLAEQVAQRIKDYILEEKLKSGDKLPTETALAREMGVARSTVREAIKPAGVTEHSDRAPRRGLFCDRPARPGG